MSKVEHIECHLCRGMGCWMERPSDGGERRPVICPNCDGTGIEQTIIKATHVYGEPPRDEPEPDRPKCYHCGQPASRRVTFRPAPGYVGSEFSHDHCPGCAKCDATSDAYYPRYVVHDVHQYPEPGRP